MLNFMRETLGDKPYRKVMHTCEKLYLHDPHVKHYRRFLYPQGETVID